MQGYVDAGAEVGEHGQQPQVARLGLQPRPDVQVHDPRCQPVRCRNSRGPLTGAARWSLWTDDAERVLQPPQGIRDVAAGLSITAVLEPVATASWRTGRAHAYREFIAPGTYSFRSRGDVDALRNVVKFHWEMVDTDGAVQAVGLKFLVLGPDGRIRTDYQFHRELSRAPEPDAGPLRPARTIPRNRPGAVSGFEIRWIARYTRASVQAAVWSRRLSSVGRASHS